MNDVLAFHEMHGLVPVLDGLDVRRAADLGAALTAGGLPSVEVTLRRPGALEVLQALAEDDDLVVGAGSLVRPAQVEQALAAGARYLVSAGFSATVARECATLDATYIPGVATATEVIQAIEHNLSVLKFFPAHMLGGPAAVRALSPPFPGIRFLATGGITEAQIQAYLRLPEVIAIGGGWLVAPATDPDPSMSQVTEVVRRSLESVRSVRAGGR